LREQTAAQTLYSQSGMYIEVYVLPNHHTLQGFSGLLSFPRHSRDFVQTVSIPILVLNGVDFYHPSATSREIVQLVQNAGAMLDRCQKLYTCPVWLILSINLRLVISNFNVACRAGRELAWDQWDRRRWKYIQQDR
jgi:hypothetical protein